MVALLALFVPSPARAADPILVRGAWYQIVNVKSGKVLGTQAGRGTPGTPVVQFDAQYTNGRPVPNQSWYVYDDAYPSGDVAMAITNGVSHKVLAIANGSTEAAASAMLWNFTQARNQYWVWDNGRFRNANSRLCLGIAAGSTANLAQAVQWHCSGALDQQWVLVRIQ